MNRNSQVKGAENAAKLREWIKVTPPGKVPLNSLGKSAKRPICIFLGIPPSTIGTNQALNELFVELDEKLQNRKEEVAEVSENSKNLEMSSADLAYVLAELELLRASNARLRHLEGTGVFIPEK